MATDGRFLKFAPRFVRRGKSPVCSVIFYGWDLYTLSADASLSGTMASLGGGGV